MKRVSPSATYPLFGLCNTTHPRNIHFQTGDIVVVRIVNIKMNPATKRVAHASRLYRNTTLHYAVDIYVKNSACVFSFGMSLNRNRSIRGQTPDQMVCLSCKPKYAGSTYGNIPENVNQTARERIRLLKRQRSFVMETRLGTDHLALLHKLVRNAVAHPTIPRVWLFQPTQPHSYRIFSTLHNRLHQHKQPLTQKQRKTYQCQAFALEFARRPKTLGKIF